MVVLGEVARLGPADAKDLLEPARGVVGDVLVERPRRGAGLEDSLDGAVLERTEAGGVSERAIEVSGVEPPAQEEDLSGVMAPGACRPGAQEPEESCGAVAEAGERCGELVEIDWALPPGGLVEAGGVSFRTGAARRELVARDAREIGGVNEELALGNADGQDVGDVLVGDGVAVALPLDEPVDAGEAVDDACGVVRMGGQRKELVLLFGAEPLERSAASTGVDDPVEPGGELGAHVVEVTKRATIEKGTLELPESALDSGLCVGVAPHSAWPEAIMGGEGQKARVVDGLGPLPPQHDGLLAVVGATTGAAPEPREGLHMALRQREEIAPEEEGEELSRAEGQDVRERLHGRARPVVEADVVRRPVALGHLAGAPIGRLEARRRLLLGPCMTEVSLYGGVPAVEPLVLDDLEDALCGDVGVGREQLGDPPCIRVGLLRPGCACRAGSERRVR